MACFWPALQNSFVGYDDPDYVTRNPMVSAGWSWRLFPWAFTTALSSNWHPLTWVSHALDCSLFGLAPQGPHLTSLVFHAANSALLFLWLAGATGFCWRCAFVALAFGLHPLHVESVAWVAERKDVLSAFFFFLTLLAYTGYARRRGAGRYVLVAVLYTAALLSKPMVVTLPLLLLVLDRWPLARREPWHRLVLEKLPLLALSAASSAVTIWAQRAGGSVAALDTLPLALRAENATYSYLAYIGKTLWPVNLAAFYPFPFNGVAAWKVASATGVLAGFALVAWIARRTHPWIASGWIWYAVMLFPVIGIVQVGMQAMADRYMYLPMIGLLIPIAWELSRFSATRLAAPLALAALAAVSWQQISYWHDGITLWTHALAVTQDNFVAHDNLGVELDARGRADEALDHYRETLHIRPQDRNGQLNYAQASFAKGERLFNSGHQVEALGAFRDGLRYRPGNALAHSYTGAILTESGNLDGAIQEFHQALGIDPNLASAYIGLSVALARTGRLAEAERTLQQCVARNNSSIEAFYNLGLIEAAQGKRAGAIAAMERALRIDPNYAPALAALKALSRR
ncbi:MAG TPA: tetratricopeptide repeat protein [Bryobacteraceae bacterium]|nr:tetratricopeptide repeat protein [Bryobacteraceae bacterium]